VIELAYFDPALPERSIAELLDCSPSNVHKLKTEGLRLLRACLTRKGIR
jgi:DNA-directed RNA polymerase specialized sigma24 family protein